MTNWMNRFAILTVLSAVLASALVVGCGGGDDDGATNTTANTATNTDDAS